MTSKSPIEGETATVIGAEKIIHRCLITQLGDPSNIDKQSVPVLAGSGSDVACTAIPGRNSELRTADARWKQTPCYLLGGRR